MSFDHISLLLKELGAVIGIPELALDAQAYCCLGFDESLRVHLRYNASADEVVLYSDLVVYKGDASENAELFESLLVANLFWQGTSGGTLAIDREAKHVYLMSREHVDGMDFQRFQSVLEDFVNRTEYWVEKLGNEQGNDVPKSEDEAPRGQLHPSDLA